MTVFVARPMLLWASDRMPYDWKGYMLFIDDCELHTLTGCSMPMLL